MLLSLLDIAPPFFDALFSSRMLLKIVKLVSISIATQPPLSALFEVK